MPSVRIVAICKEQKEYPIVFDAVLYRKRVKRNLPVFGIKGKVLSFFYPFVLQADGQIDFGSDYEGTGVRYYKCNIRERDIELGIEFTTEEWSEEESRTREFVYSIHQIEPLSGG